MRAIAFDAATVTGWAYRDTAGAWVSGTLDPHDHKYLDLVLDAARDAGATVAAIEDCYLGPSVRTHKVLAGVQGLLTAACERKGLRVEVVPASTWQADYGITGVRDDRKRGAMHVATRILGADVESQDEADAVCMCDYAERAGLGVEVSNE